jgi:hypothetical protein
MSEKSKLKPCPFCGADAAVYLIKHPHDTGQDVAESDDPSAIDGWCKATALVDYSVEVVCDECTASLLPVSHEGDEEPLTAAEAAAVWNERKGGC